MARPAAEQLRWKAKLAIAKLGENPRLAKAKGVKFFDLRANLRRDLEKIAIEGALIESAEADLKEQYQIFVIEHDWSAAFRGADGLPTSLSEVKPPFDRCVFEFLISGVHVCALVRPGSGVIVWVKLPIGWMVTTSDAAHPVGKFVEQQIVSVCLALDAQVAETLVVKSAQKPNRAAARRGLAALPDYRIVRLSRRSASIDTGAHSDRKRPRLHFRRGHWRHVPEPVWIRWTLVGDPDLGFVDKQYRI